jgi:hypothetical protein
MTNKSIAISPFTMPAALAAADILLGNPAWEANPDNSGQVRWLESFRRRAGIAAELPEIRRNATTVAVDHVAWLKAEGWDAQITQGSPSDLFLAATINIVAKWKEAGRAYKAGSVDRVLLKKGATAAYDRSNSNRHRAVTVSTQHAGYAFLFQQLDYTPYSAEHLLDIVLEASGRSSYDEVHLDFPMVDLHIKDDARYMIGLRSGLNVVTQAAEQLKLEMNEIGGRASAAAEVAVTRGMSMGPEMVRIEGPFVVAVIRVGAPNDADRVAFAAYVDRDAWKRPADGRI